MKSSSQANHIVPVLSIYLRCLTAMTNASSSMDSVWWCVASGTGYLECPVDLQKTFRRGTRVKAAAWKRPTANGGEFFVAIAAEIQKCDDEAGARSRYSVDFNKKNGTFGTKLRNCDKIVLKTVFRAGLRFRNYFYDFEVIRDDSHNITTASSAIVPHSVSEMMILQGSITGSDTETFDHYASLGLQEGASQEQVKSAYHTLARLYHPDKSNGLADVSKFIAAQNAYEVLTGRRAEGNDVIVAPKHRKLSATNDYEAIDTEVHVLLQYKQKLETELQLVEMRIRQAKDIKSEKHHIDHREEAVTFTQHFVCLLGTGRRQT